MSLHFAFFSAYLRVLLHLHVNLSFTRRRMRLWFHWKSSRFLSWTKCPKRYEIYHRMPFWNLWCTSHRSCCTSILAPWISAPSVQTCRLVLKQHSGSSKYTHHCFFALVYVFLCEQVALLAPCWTSYAIDRQPALLNSVLHHCFVEASSRKAVHDVLIGDGHALQDHMLSLRGFSDTGTNTSWRLCLRAEVVQRL